MVQRGKSLGVVYLGDLWIKEVAGVRNNIFISVSKHPSTWGNKSRKMLIRYPIWWEGEGRRQPIQTDLQRKAEVLF